MWPNVRRGYLLACALICSAALFAQSDNSTISGTVKAERRSRTQEFQ